VKTFLIALCVVAGGVSPVAAAEDGSGTTATTQTTDAPKPKPDPLIEAAKAAKAKRKASDTKVITNKDVKKSKGKLIVLDKPAKEEAVVADAPKTSSLEQHDQRYHARVLAAEAVTAHEKKVASLEKDLEAIEQRYYEENDPNYRDSVIQKRFAQAKRQLDEARLQLADSRDALKKLEAQP
jgi:hypothetical protein